jgi:hypothetical protein
MVVAPWIFQEAWALSICGFAMVDFHIIVSLVVKLCCYNIHIDQLWGKCWEFNVIIDNTK